MFQYQIKRSKGCTDCLFRLIIAAFGFAHSLILSHLGSTYHMDATPRKFSDESQPRNHSARRRMWLLRVWMRKTEVTSAEEGRRAGAGRDNCGGGRWIWRPRRAPRGRSEQSAPVHGGWMSCDFVASEGAAQALMWGPACLYSVLP